jgi:nucleoside-diphosphate-sugar epimerase
MVTGASGFIGSHLTRRLDAAGAKLHLLMRPASSLRRLEELSSRTAVWRGDVTDYDSVLRCYQGAMPEAVVHLAADTTSRRFDGNWAAVDRSTAVNLQGTLNLLRGASESSAPIRILLRTGTLEEYGTGPTPFDEAQRERPTSPYSASQTAATHFCQMLQQHVAFAVTTVRPALVYGPAQSTSFFIPGLIRSCLRGIPFDMTSGTQRRDLLYVDDLVDALLRALSRPDLRGLLLNVGSNEDYGILQVGEEIVRLCGAHGILRVGVAPQRSADPANLIVSNRRANEILGWRPTTELTEGLRRTIAWYRSHPDGDEC